MRSNSGSGKSSNNLRDPTMKEHEKVRDKLGKRAVDAEPGQRQRAEAGPID